jgi:hypothetical protein
MEARCAREAEVDSEPGQQMESAHRVDGVNQGVFPRG